MSQRKRYSPEFKREAIGFGSPSRWVREAQSGGEKAFLGTGSPRDEELARLKRELAGMTKGRDF